MKVDGPRGRLFDAHQTIRAQWDVVCELWSDSTRTEFEEHVWTPLDRLTSDELRAIDRLRQILNQCRRECAGES